VEIIVQGIFGHSLSLSLSLSFTSSASAMLAETFIEKKQPCFRDGYRYERRAGGSHHLAGNRQGIDYKIAQDWCLRAGVTPRFMPRSLVLFVMSIWAGDSSTQTAIEKNDATWCRTRVDLSQPSTVCHIGKCWRCLRFDRGTVDRSDY